MPYGEYVAMIVSHALDMGEYAPSPPVRDNQQEELPLKTA